MHHAPDPGQPDHSNLVPPEHFLKTIVSAGAASAVLVLSDNRNALNAISNALDDHVPSHCRALIRNPQSPLNKIAHIVHRCSCLIAHLSDEIPAERIIMFCKSARLVIINRIPAANTSLTTGTANGWCACLIHSQGRDTMLLAAAMKPSPIQQQQEQEGEILNNQGTDAPENTGEAIDA